MSLYETRAKSHCLELIESWKSFNINDLNVSDLTGGLTNELLIVSLNPSKLENDNNNNISIKPQKVVVRFYGACSGLERETEIQIYTFLSEKNVTAKLLGKFEDGRIEEYLNAHRLHRQDFQNLETLKDVAYQMGLIHSIENVPCSKDITIFESVLSLFEKAKQKKTGEIFMKYRQENGLLIQNWDQLEKEMKQAIQTAENSNSDKVFTHNDFQSGNILRDVNTSKLTIIDFEYASYNPRGFDFGNFFAEMCIDNFAENEHGFHLEEKNYPTNDMQTLFFRTYLSACKPDLIDEKQIQNLIEAMKIEAYVFNRISHLKWCLWAISQNEESKIKWGYIEYAQQRLTTFMNMKK